MRLGSTRVWFCFAAEFDAHHVPDRDRPVSAAAVSSNGLHSPRLRSRLGRAVLVRRPIDPLNSRLSSCAHSLTHGGFTVSIIVVGNYYSGRKLHSAIPQSQCCSAALRCTARSVMRSRVACEPTAKAAVACGPGRSRAPVLVLNPIPSHPIQSAASTGLARHCRSDLRCSLLALQTDSLRALLPNVGGWVQLLSYRTMR